MFDVTYYSTFVEASDVILSFLSICWLADHCVTEGEHTRTKTMVASKVGGLMAFAKKKSSCIGCKVPLDDNSRWPCGWKQLDTNCHIKRVVLLPFVSV